MKKPHPINAFIEEYRLNRPTSIEEYALFCKAGIKLAYRYPVGKSEIAYIILGETSKYVDETNPDPLIAEIRYLAGQLELPDDVVYTGDGTSVKEKWRILKDDVNELVESLNIKP